jgi:hypothetical protein
MLKLLFAFFCLFLAPDLYAQSTCPAPDQSVVVFFGNGIATTEVDAKRSINALRLEIGDTYNGQKVRYDVAYNKTNGMVVDLVQSAAQALIQWNSQVMGWFNGLGVVPDWFNLWYQKFLLAFTTVVAEELPEHVAKYSTAIALGQKVVVVVHSQGNFYVNQAKMLMQQELPANKMQGFAVFGVAVPSDNVGGASSPYYTNNRDFIFTIPNALPQNWTLKHISGALAQDVGPFQAHKFVDTYMSTEFDIRPALVSGIKTQMNVAQQPVAECDNYWSHLTAFFAGTYPMTLTGGKSASLIINASGQISSPPTLSPVTFAASPSFGLQAGWTYIGPTSDLGVFYLDAQRLTGAERYQVIWDGKNKFISASCRAVSSHPDCNAADIQQPSYLQNSQLIPWMGQLMAGSSAYLHCKSAVDNSPVPGVTTIASWVFVSVPLDGASVIVHDTVFTINAGSVKDEVVVGKTFPKLEAPDSNDPTISMTSTTLERTTIGIGFSWSRGIRSFGISSQPDPLKWPTADLDCQRDLI